MRKLLAIGTLVVLGVLVATFLLGRGGASSALEPGVTDADEPLPRLQGVTLDGGRADSRDLRGEVAVINVWATWCDPCLKEMPALQNVFERYQERGVAFLGINYRDDAAKARAQVRATGVTYPSIVDRAGSYADDLGFPALPDTYVVGRDGRIRFIVFGATDEEELAALIDELLAS